jgi:hypothetical protein
MTVVIPEYQGEGTAVAQWLMCCATIRKVAGSIPASVSGFFFDIKSFQSHYGPGNLNFLEPFGPVQACNGTALPVPEYQGSRT